MLGPDLNLRRSLPSQRVLNLWAKIRQCSTHGRLIFSRYRRADIQLPSDQRRAMDDSRKTTDDYKLNPRVIEPVQQQV